MKKLLSAGKVLCFALCVIMIFSILPLDMTRVFAADTAPKNVMLGIGQIKGAQANNVYFGTYQQSANVNGSFNTDPIKWRVLSNTDGSLFLLSDQNIEYWPFHAENDTPWGTCTWATCTLRSRLNGHANNYIGANMDNIDYSDNNFLDTAFSAQEQTAIADTNLGTIDKVFLLSVEDVASTAYGFTNNSTRIARNTAYVGNGGSDSPDDSNFGADEADWWYLRSMDDEPNNAVNVTNNGILLSATITDYRPIRPAFHMDAAYVLFTGAADNSGQIDFSIPTAYSGTDFKVTVKDNNSFARNASVNQTTVTPGDTLTITHKSLSSICVNYTNVTAVLTDANGSLLCYGSINSDPSATSSTLTLPENLELGARYILSVYGEDRNAACHTDFATGTPFVVTLQAGCTACTDNDNNGFCDICNVFCYPQFKIENGSLLISKDSGGTWAELGVIGNGKGIESITLTDTNNNTNTYTILYNDGSCTTFSITNGTNGQDGKTPLFKIENAILFVSYDNRQTWESLGVIEAQKGEDGIGIVSVEKTASDGLLDTYTITYSDQTTATFTVTNGAQGMQGVHGAQGIQGIQGIPGKDGHTPVISIIDGFWIIDGISTNIPAVGSTGTNGKDGTDGITPKLQINPSTNMWEVSYDNGATWTSMGITATGADGKDGKTSLLPIVISCISLCMTLIMFCIMMVQKKIGLRPRRRK